MGIYLHSKICTGIEKMVDRAPTMGVIICNLDDEMGQSVLVQTEQNAFWREEKPIYYNSAVTDGRNTSLEKCNTSSSVDTLLKKYCTTNIMHGIANISADYIYIY